MPLLLVPEEVALAISIYVAMLLDVFVGAEPEELA